MRNPVQVWYIQFTRHEALSEVLWSTKKNKNWDDIKNRLQQQYKRYDLLNVRYNTKGNDKE